MLFSQYLLGCRKDSSQNIVLKVIMWNIYFLKYFWLDQNLEFNIYKCFENELRFNIKRNFIIYWILSKLEKKRVLFQTIISLFNFRCIYFCFIIQIDWKLFRHSLPIKSFKIVQCYTEQGMTLLIRAEMEPHTAQM